MTVPYVKISMYSIQHFFFVKMGQTGIGWPRASKKAKRQPVFKPQMFLSNLV